LTAGIGEALVATEGKTIDALSQFELTPVLGIIGRSVGFSQSNLHMVVASGLIIALLVYGMRSRAVVPGRLQAAAETMYDFVHGIVDEQIGHGGKRFFPFVFALFMFVLMGNLLGLMPYAFTYTSHIAVTFGLALLVFVVITVVALVIHGKHFFSYFFPEGTPIWLAPIIIPVEVVSYLYRPVGRAWHGGALPGHAAARHQRRPGRVRSPGGRPASLCLRRPDQHLSA
jgi:F-type H+-transporting ATPase subunit a